MIDSWSWVEYFRGSKPGQRAKEYIEGEEDAVISAVNLAEVYRWVLRFYDEAQAEEARRTMTTKCTLIPVDESIAVEAARLRHSTQLGLGDSIILATARSVGAKIVTGDPELKAYRDVNYLGR